VIKELKKNLDELELHSFIVEASDELPLEHLFVILGLDGQKREQKLKIVSAQESSFLQNSDSSIPHSIHFVEFSSTFPFNCTDLATNDLSALIHFVNNSNSFPGFQFNEITNKVSFRYIWMTSTDKGEKEILQKIIQNIQMNLILFSEVIEDVCLEKTTFNKVLSEIIEQFKT